MIHSLVKFVTLFNRAWEGSDWTGLVDLRYSHDLIFANGKAFEKKVINLSPV